MFGVNEHIVVQPVRDGACMPIAIELLGAQHTLAIAAHIRKVYHEAFAAPPYDRDMLAAQFFAADTLPRHMQRDDFRCVVARNQHDGEVVGFGYGYTGAVGQWWTDAVAQQMSPDLTAYWLPDHFELVELAVLPALHGRGIGGMIHGRLLHGLPHRRALLSTAQQWTPARALYNKRGWQVLLPQFLFPASSRPYVIMGKEL